MISRQINIIIYYVQLSALKQDRLNDFNPESLWDINNAKAIKVQKRITDMVAMDNQPLQKLMIKALELLVHLQPRYLIPSIKYYNETMLLHA